MDPKTTAVSNTESTERKKWINQNREEYDLFIERKKWVNQNREEYDQFIKRKKWVNQNKEEYDQSIYEITSDQLVEKVRSLMKLQKKEVEPTIPIPHHEVCANKEDLIKLVELSGTRDGETITKMTESSEVGEKETNAIPKEAVPDTIETSVRELKEKKAV